LQSTATDADVIVVGFGPVGAAVAGLLGRRGLTVLVLERDTSVFPLPRAAHVDHTGLRTWQELGVLDQLLPRMVPNNGLDFVTGNGDLLARIPNGGLSPAGLPFSRYFYQPELDRTIRDEVASLPSVEVHLDTTVAGVTSGATGVTVEAFSGARQHTFTASWLVACDGAASPIREGLGIEIEDFQFEEPWVVVDLVLPAQGTEPADRAVCVCDPARPTYSIPMPMGRHRFEFRLMPGDDPAGILKPAQLDDLIGEWFDPRQVQVERAAVYTFHGLVARRWRKDRIFLAGDAAHQMPPFLGQGMCSGLRDAVNLAWKLDLVIRGKASDGLLDTYEAERRPHVSAVVTSAVSIGRVICTVDPAQARERDQRMLGDSRPPSRRMPFTLPALGPGPLVLENGGAPFIQPVTDQGRLDDIVGPRFAVFARDPSLLDSDAARWWRDTAGAFVAALPDLPDTLAAALRAWLDERDSDIVLVRPDRYVLWAGASLGEVTQPVLTVLGWSSSVEWSMTADPDCAAPAP
jgi:3-(3-hydroxy-phenyl)propionate hydroxylase